MYLLVGGICLLMKEAFVDLVGWMFGLLFVFVVVLRNDILLGRIRLGLFSGVDLSGSILLGGFSCVVFAGWILFGGFSWVDLVGWI